MKSSRNEGTGSDWPPESALAAEGSEAVVETTATVPIILEDPVVKVVKGLVMLAVQGDWIGIEAICKSRWFTAEEMASAVSAYGRTLINPPDHAWDELDVELVDGRATETLHVRCPLWTKEEGRSDLEIQLTLREVVGEPRTYKVDIEGIFVA